MNDIEEQPTEQTRKIFLLKKTHYGIDRYYLDGRHGLEFARGLKKLTGRKSLTEDDIDGLQKIGFDVQVPS